MIRLIAAKDFTEFVRDGRLYWAGGLVAVLLVSALAVGWDRYREVSSERQAAQALDYDDWIAQPERHPHTAAHQGMHVFKPQPPLSVVDPGIDPYVGSTIWLQAHRQSEVRFRPAQDATGLQRFGELSPAWVLQVLAPLLLVVLGFGAFAAERELGTLRQTLSLGIPASTLLWGKAAALLGAVGLLLIPGLVGGALAAGFSADALARLAWLTAGYGVYLAVIAFLVLAVSAVAPSSRIALVALLGLWIGGVLLAPRAASDLSRVWHPSPTRLAFNAALDGDLGRVGGKAWNERFGVTTAWSPQVPLDQWGVALQMDDAIKYPVMDQHFGALWNTFSGQQRAQEWLGLAVPVLAIRAFSMGIAGTDFAHHRSFAVAAEQHRRVIQDVVSQDLVAHADARGAGHFDYRAGHELWERVPPFAYTAPRLSFGLGNSLRSFVILSASLLAAITLARLAFRRRLLA